MSWGCLKRQYTILLTSYNNVQVIFIEKSLNKKSDKFSGPPFNLIFEKDNLAYKALAH